MYGLKALCWLIWPLPAVASERSNAQRETVNVPAYRSVTRLLMNDAEMHLRPAIKTASNTNVPFLQAVRPPLRQDGDLVSVPLMCRAVKPKLSPSDDRVAVEHRHKPLPLGLILTHIFGNSLDKGSPKQRLYQSLQ